MSGSIVMGGHGIPVPQVFDLNPMVHWQAVDDLPQPGNEDDDGDNGGAQDAEQTRNLLKCPYGKA